jgi:trans-2,3-dihydro-3-hydroxyanthranilate isomerase
MTSVRYRIVDVFADGPFSGNSLAVFPQGEEVAANWMPRIANELNLSEITFVTGRTIDSYDVRIFTRRRELPFAGHPTIGTSWVLSKLGMVRSPRIIQNSPAGRTLVTLAKEAVWFERSGSIRDHSIEPEPYAEAVGTTPKNIVGQSWLLGGRPLHPRPCVTDAGLPVVLLPVDPEAITELKPTMALSELSANGVYCWSVVGASTLKTRFFAPGLGVVEDPATGAAAAALGIYIASQLGETKFDITQGAEVGRPSRILVEASAGRVKVGGAVLPIGHGTINLPARG